MSAGIERTVLITNKRGLHARAGYWNDGGSLGGGHR